MRVFLGVSELMTDSEFVSANQDFFERHCEQFDANVEENKHEYKQIYEEFLKVQEDIIEAKLREKFSEDDVLAFYESLQEDIKVYEQKDKETVDFLYEMIDFDKFKAKMCNAKALNLMDRQLAAAKLQNTEMLKSRADFDIKVERALFDQRMAESVTSQEHGWKKRLDQPDWKNDLIITVWSKKQEQSKNDLFRMRCKYRGIKLKDALEFFKTLPADKFDMIKIEKYEDVVQTPDESLWSAIRYRVTTAPMITDRDALSVVSFTKDAATGKYFFATRSIEDDRYPEQSDRVRIFVTETYEMEESVEEGQVVTTISGFSLYDVRGYVPPSILNMTAANNFLKFQTTLIKIMKN